MARNTVSLLQCPGAALMRALLSRLSWQCLSVVLLIMFAGTAVAHEIRPAYLGTTEKAKSIAAQLVSGIEIR